MRTESQSFTDSTVYNRFTFYETWFNNCVASIREVKSVDGSWYKESSMSVLKDVFGCLKAKTGSCRFIDGLGAVGLTVKAFTQKK